MTEFNQRPMNWADKVEAKHKLNLNYIGKHSTRIKSD